MNFSELKTKEIVRVSDGKKLGFADDLVIDESTYSVVALRVLKPSRAFKRPEHFEISFKSISKIGENVILIEEESDTSASNEKQERGEYYYSPKVFKRVDRKSKILNKN